MKKITAVRTNKQINENENLIYYLKSEPIWSLLKSILYRSFLNENKDFDKRKDSGSKSL